MIVRILVLAISILGLSSTVEAQTVFVVNSTAHPGDGLCDDGECTLLEAMEASNTAVGVDTILFALEGEGPHTIQPDPWLPILVDPVVIDGYSQQGSAQAGPGSPAVLQIQIDGSNAAADVHGLEFETDGSWVRGLVVNRFARGGVFLLGDNNVVEGCFIGTSFNGTNELGNGFASDDGFTYDGVWIAGGSGNRIGGPDPAQSNLLSGNANAGVYVGSSGNLIEGNLIGTNVTGDSPLGNDGAGITLFGANETTIRGNTISGNDWFGIDVFDNDGFEGPTDNVIAANRIGTDVSGMSRVGNVSGGILINGSRNTIGGADGGNVVSGNLGSGIVIYDPEGSVTSTGNLVVGNLVGLNSAGSDTLGNLGTGVRVVGSGNLVGGEFTMARNVISGNLFAGVSIRGDETVDSVASNVVEGNWIGTDVTGKKALGNIEDGVAIIESEGNEVTSNLLVANYGGVFIREATSIANTVEGNLIGTDEDGTTGLGNFDYGVDILEGEGNVVSDNLIAFNGSGGVNITLDRPSGKRGRSYGSTLVRVSDGRGGHRVAPMPNPDRDTGPHPRKTSATAAAGEGNLVSGNRMFSNGAIGIDLGQDGRTLNDAGDGDEGANRLQNTPSLVSASLEGTGLTLEFRVATDTANAAYPLTVQVYQADELGQGALFVGEAAYTAEQADMLVTAVLTVDGSVSDGAPLVATASDADGNTSEFSDPVTVGGPPVAIEDDASSISDFSLDQNYPNPFGQNGQATTISYTLPEAAEVAVRVYDPLGRVVLRPIAGSYQPAGRHTIMLDPGQLPSGVYTYVLRVADKTFTRQMTILR